MYFTDLDKTYQLLLGKETARSKLKISPLHHQNQKRHFRYGSKFQKVK